MLFQFHKPDLGQLDPAVSNRNDAQIYSFVNPKSGTLFLLNSDKINDRHKPAGAAETIFSVWIPAGRRRQTL